VAVRQVLTWGDPRLKSKNVDVGDWTPDLHRLVVDMFETIIAHEGAGLAAPQVGINIRLAVIDVGDGGKAVLINPEIVKEEGEQEGS
jgi:peptide deformylase